jgi:hypothetical protein
MCLCSSAISASGRFCCKGHCRYTRPGALRRLSALQAMPMQFQKTVDQSRTPMVDDPTSAALHGRRVRSPSSRKHRTAGRRPQKGDRFARRGALKGYTWVGRVRRGISRQRHKRKTRITVSCPRCGIGADFLVLIMSRRPPRCHRAEANSLTLELTSGTDGPWFDLVITQWYPTGRRIGEPSRWSQRLAWSQRSLAFAFSPWIARTTRSSPISASRRK